MKYVLFVIQFKKGVLVTSTATRAGGIYSLLNGEATDRALCIGGMDDALRRRLTENPELLGKVAVEAMREALEKDSTEEQNRRRREQLACLIKDCAPALNSRERNLLMRSGIYTVGDLAMQSEQVLMNTRGFGIKTLRKIDALLLEPGLRLRGPIESEVACALRLYGGAEYIPARYLTLWEYQLDGATKDVLRNVLTLGELSTLTQHEFLDAYGHYNGLSPATPVRQLSLVRGALKKVDLDFRDD